MARKSINSTGSNKRKRMVEKYADLPKKLKEEGNWEALG